MALPVSFRWDEELVARIDRARGLVPRSAWVRAAVEQALGDGDGHRAPASAEQPRMTGYQPEDGPVRRGPVADKSGIPNERATVGTAPAEQPERPPRVREPAERRGVMSSSLSKRDVRPIPKAKP